MKIEAALYIKLLIVNYGCSSTDVLYYKTQMAAKWLFLNMFQLIFSLVAGFHKFIRAPTLVCNYCSFNRCRAWQPTSVQKLHVIDIREPTKPTQAVSIVEEGVARTIWHSSILYSRKKCIWLQLLEGSWSKPYSKYGLETGSILFAPSWQVK